MDPTEEEDVPVPPEPHYFEDLPLQFTPLTDNGRKLERISMSGMIEVPAEGNGDCLFNSFAMLVYRDQKYHKRVRREICDELDKNRQIYSLGTTAKAQGTMNTEQYKEFVETMRKDGVWGNMITLQAAANIYEARLILITSWPDIVMKQVRPTHKLYRKDLFFSLYTSDTSGHINPLLHPSARQPYQKFKGKKKQELHAEPDWYTIRVSDLHQEVTTEDLRQKFQEHGEVVGVEMQLDNDGFPLGSGIVRMRNCREFSKAIICLNGEDMGGHPMVVEAANHYFNPHLANRFEASLSTEVID